ncbi:thioesterase family protein [Caulobacter sp. 1776]|uniref:acyl-CoA thioesterase n=1 Tax=Caulobacter sp. 1776 TaxID=3156420 RepID=UPI00339937EC
MSRVFVPPSDAYSLTILPTASDIDANGHVNNVVYLSWVQDLAIAHWEAWATPEQRAPWTWVCRRHEVDYRRELLLGETATGYTWVGELKGPRFERFARIDGPDGEMCAQTRTDWVLIDIAAKRPARVEPWMVERFTPKG